MRSMIARLARSLALALALAPVTTALAQDSTVIRHDRDTQRVLLSVNPLGILAGGLSGEGELRVTPQQTLAIASTYWSFIGLNYTSVDLKYRVYTQHTGQFRGLAFGPMAGMQFASIDECRVSDARCRTRGITAGFTVDYLVQFGESQRGTFAFGGGGKTIFGVDKIRDLRLTYPFVRLGIGYAFGGR